jgi:hypothetical protein
LQVLSNKCLNIFQKCSNVGIARTAPKSRKTARNPLK